jgi:hypothetical protein
MIFHASRIGRHILILALTLAAIAYAQETGPVTHNPLIAVNTLEGRGITPDEAATLTDVLRTELLNTGKYKVMERTQMEAILKEQGFQQSGACTDQQCMIEMGQLLGAELLVAGSVGKVGKAFSINVRVISIKTSEILSNVSQAYTGPIEDLLTSEMKKVVLKLTAEPAKVKQAGKAAPEQQKPAEDKKQVAQKPGLNGTILAITGGAIVVIGGGTAAYFILNKGKKSGNPEPTPTTSVDLIW